MIARHLRRACALVTIPTLAWLGSPRDAQPAAPGATSPARADTCAVCHPAAAKALAFTPHGDTGRSPAVSCTACHGEQRAHVDSALDPNLARVAADPVLAAACAACHADGRAPAGGAHPWTPQLDRTPALPRVQDPAPPPLPVDKLPSGRTLGYELGMLARAGYRFVNVFGARERYDSDLNLDGGVRLTDLELQAFGGADSAVDRVQLSLRDLADPSMRLRAEATRDDAFTAKGHFHRDAFLYRARGDFHRVDRRSEEWGFAIDVELAAESSVFASYTRRLQDGFWLTNRIGNRNVTPITTVNGVASPRQHDADHVEVGVRGRVFGLRATAAVDYREHGDVDRWIYSQPAVQNPLALESEDFGSGSSLRGPGARVSVGETFGALRVDANARVIDLQRRTRGNGTGTGFDVAAFDTTTTAFAEGGAQTWLVDTTATWELGDDVSLLGDLRWRDHAEDVRFDQTDVVRYPTLNTTTTTSVRLLQRTAQRTFEGSAGFEVRPWKPLTLAAGWGFAREWLKVPDLEAGDADFVRGRIADDGLYADLRWKPTARWTASAGWRDFGQNGIQLHELADDDVRGLKGRLRYQPTAWWAEAFTEHRRKANDVSGTRLEAWTSGIALGIDVGDDLDLWASYSFTDLESRTLTNFYFDPVPQPVPTLVGFDGTTHAVAAGAKAALARRTTLELSGSLTSTRGTFDVSVFDVRADLSVKACSTADVGLMVRHIDYRESMAQSAGLDDYGAYVTFLYFRTRLGRIE